MGFFGDLVDNEEGVSEIIGVMLIIGIIMILLALGQSLFVPQWNKEVEWNHYQEVTDDIVNTKSSILRASSLGDVSSSEVKLGTEYPDRYFFINPAAATGELRTYSLSLNITNATATNKELNDYWNNKQINYKTKGIIYKPNYNYQDGVQPYLIEHTGLIRYYQKDNTDPKMMEQSMFQGKTIQPTILKGNISKNGHILESLEIYPGSAPPNSIKMQNLDLKFTTIAPQAWKNYLDYQNNSYITNIEINDLNKKTLGHNISKLNIKLNKSYNYSLKLSSLSLENPYSEVTDEKPPQKDKTNLTLVTDQNNHTAPATLTARVLNQYNNPVSGVPVTFSSDSEIELNGKNQETIVSNEEGYTRIRATNPSNTPITVSANINEEKNSWSIVNYSIESRNGAGESYYQIHWTKTENNEITKIIEEDEFGPTEIEYHAHNDSNNKLEITATLYRNRAPFLVDDANVDFAVNNSNLATTSPPENTTTNGETNTSIKPNQFNQRFEVYAISGGSTDQITIIPIKDKPNVSINSVIYNKNSGNQDNNISVNFTASDPDNNLNNYTIKVYDRNGDLEEFVEGDLSSSGETKTVIISGNLPDGQRPFTVNVSVTDKGGLSDSDSQQSSCGIFWVL